MTHLELVAEVGSEPMEVVKMYFSGHLTVRELHSVLGKKRADLVEQYAKERHACKTG